jgi:hypothetical protein
MQIHDIVVQVAKPTESFGGQVEEGRYTWEDGIVTLVDAKGVARRDRKGQVYQKTLTPEENPRTIAGRLTKQRFNDYNAKSEFWRPLTYKTVNY